MVQNSNKLDKPLHMPKIPNRHQKTNITIHTLPKGSAQNKTSKHSRPSHAIEPAKPRHSAGQATPKSWTRHNLQIKFKKQGTKVTVQIPFEGINRRRRNHIIRKPIPERYYSHREKSGPSLNITVVDKKLKGVSPCRTRDI